MASRNRKKIATETRLTILTDRSACRDRTLALSSCTANDTQIRRVMFTSNSTNCTTPCGTSSFLGSDTQPRACSSDNPCRNDLGNADSSTVRINTTATSSSSVRLESCAHDKSSLPMPKDTENARSDASAPSAPAVSAINTPKVTQHFPTVCKEQLRAAAFEKVGLPPRLAFQKDHYLFLRRLIVEQPRPEDGRRRRPARTKHTRDSDSTKMRNSGVVIGATLGNLLQHCRGSKHSIKFVISQLHRVLTPACNALGTCRGDDVPYLVKGMLCHRVLRTQAKNFRELFGVPPLDNRTGHIGVAVGACAAVLIAFECMEAANNCENCNLSSQLTACLRQVHDELCNWRVTDAITWDSTRAINAEARAVERARAGVAFAQTRAVLWHMTQDESFSMQLEYYRRAVWPRGETVGADTQPKLLEAIASGKFVDFVHPSEVFGSTLPLPSSAASAMTVVPLSALPGVVTAGIGAPERARATTGVGAGSCAGGERGEGGGASTDSASDAGASSVSGSSSWGSLASSIDSLDAAITSCTSSSSCISIAAVSAVSAAVTISAVHSLFDSHTLAHAAHQASTSHRHHHHYQPQLRQQQQQLHIGESPFFSFEPG